MRRADLGSGVSALCWPRYGVSFLPYVIDMAVSEEVSRGQRSVVLGWTRFGEGGQIMSRFKESSLALKADRRRAKSQHPYAAIEHRVIDSPAFQDIKHSSSRLLLILARQLNQYGNNGHLQATWSYCRLRGFGSEETLRGAIRDLIAHRLLYRTHSSGANKQWAKYALTWLPIRDSKNLYLHAWEMDAWRNWQPGKKSTPKKAVDQAPRLQGNHAENATETGGVYPLVSGGYVLVPSGAGDPNLGASDLNRGGSG